MAIFDSSLTSTENLKSNDVPLLRNELNNHPMDLEELLSEIQNMTFLKSTVEIKRGSLNNSSKFITMYVHTFSLWFTAMEIC